MEKAGISVTEVLTRDGNNENTPGNEAVWFMAPSVKPSGC